MTANKMFKEIGYKERSWEKNNYDSEMLESTITFDRRNIYIGKLGEPFVTVLVEDVQAIYKKCQELGWIK